MHDEDEASSGLLDVMQVPSDKSQARTMADRLTELAERSLKRGAYALAEKQAAKAVGICEDILQERSNLSLRALNALCVSLELNGRLADAQLKAELLLKQSQIVPVVKEFECSAELELARIALIQNKLPQADSRFKQAIESASDGLNQDLKRVHSPADVHRALVLIDALNDYSGFLRRTQRGGEKRKKWSYVSHLWSH